MSPEPPTDDFAWAKPPALPFHGVVPVRIDHAGQARLPALGELTNHVGTVAAGAIFSLADVASGTLLASVLDEGQQGVVASVTVRFRWLDRGELVAVAVLGDRPAGAVPGGARPRFDVAVTVADDTGVVVAEASFSWSVLAAPDSPHSRR